MVAEQTRPRAADTSDPTPPCDLLAEQILIGSALMNPHVLADTTAEGLTVGDFWKPAHQTIWATITRLAATTGACDPAMVLADLQTHRELDRIGGGPYLIDTMTAVPTTANAGWYAHRVHGLARARKVAETGRRLVQLANNPGTDTVDLEDMLEAAARTVLDTLDTTPAIAAPLRHVDNIDEFLNSPEPEYRWLIPGAIEVGDRLMLTGPEGGGKSVFCRQFAIQTAAGIHPFTGHQINPIRVTYLDLENSPAQSRREFRTLRHQAGGRLDAEQFHIEVSSQGIDLLDPLDQAWLDQLIATTRPNLFVTGPLYRMASGDPNEEKTARPVSQALDRVRATGAAIIIETHAPHAQTGQRRRPRRPYGASLWVRWPEFGLWLDEDGTIEHWRGARDQREWPLAMKRGGEWPWMPNNDPQANLWEMIVHARDAFGEQMTIRELEEVVNVSRSTIGRCLKTHSDEWKRINEGHPDAELD